MSNNSQVQSVLCGSSLDLKRGYQKNMIKAQLIIIAAIGLLIIVAAVFAGDPPRRVTTTIAINADTADVLPPPPQIDPKRTLWVAPPADNKPLFTLPEPAPDSLVPDLPPLLISQEELAKIIGAGVPSGSDGIGAVGYTPGVIEELIPPPDSFFAVEEQPQKVSFPAPVYPEIARKAEIEGSVWLRVFVDKTGRPREVLIGKPSGANAGFEEAAIDAALRSVWRPAMQNRQPIGVWISYEVRFRLR